MQKPLLAAALLALAACSNQEAGRSQYFDRLNDPARTAPPVVTLDELGRTGQLAPVAQAAPAAPTGDAELVASLNAAIAQAGIKDAAPVMEEQVTAIPLNPVEEPTSVIGADPGGVPVEIAGSTEISDNSFETVKQRESIETDRERLAALASQRVELEAEPLPERDTSVNLAAFARSTSHKIGDRVYARTGQLSSRAAAQCRKYRNPDEAQRDFLAQGGPQEDPMRIDPDGDGFVCGWSPMPFRALALPG